MSECKCDLRTKLVGDGCSVCNPELWKYLLEDSDEFEDDADMDDFDGKYGY